MSLIVISLSFQFPDFAKIPEWHSGFVKALRPCPPIRIMLLASGQRELPSTRQHGTFSSQTPYSSISSPVHTKTQRLGKRQQPLSIAGSSCVRRHSWLAHLRIQASTSTPGGTTFVEKGEFSGLLAFLMSPSLIAKQIMGQFKGFDADLKERAESVQQV